MTVTAISAELIVLAADRERFALKLQELRETLTELSEEAKQLHYKHHNATLAFWDAQFFVDSAWRNLGWAEEITTDN